MGRGMTTDSPAVEKVEQQAQLAAGQEPQVAVKQESPTEAAALAHPPKPVTEQQVEQVGKKDQESGRQILQPSESPLQNERLAADAAPELATKLSQIAASVPGAKFDRLRPRRISNGLKRRLKMVNRQKSKDCFCRMPEVIALTKAPSIPTTISAAGSAGT